MIWKLGKKLRTGKEKIKLSFVGNMIFFVENLKSSMNKKWELLREFSKISALKINIPNSTVFLDTKKKSDRECNKVLTI